MEEKTYGHYFSVCKMFPQGLLLFLLLNFVTLLVLCDPVSQRAFQTHLSQVDQFIYIQSSATQKFLTSSQQKRLTRADPLFVPLDLSLESEPLDKWRVRQTVGFPFREGKFSPVYKISSKNRPSASSQFSRMLWLLKPSESKENEFQLTRPYEPYKCLMESIGSQEVGLSLCNDTGRNGLWRITSFVL